MNRAQREIFRQLALMLSKYELDDIRVALLELRKEDLFPGLLEGAARASNARRTEHGDRAPKKRVSLKERLAKIEDDVVKNGSEGQRVAFKVAKMVLDRHAFSSVSEIHRILEHLGIDAAKSAKDRNALAITLYLSLSDKEVNEIENAERILAEHSSGHSSLSAWSELINRGESGLK